MEADIWAAPVNSFPQIENEPQVRHNGTLINFEHPKVNQFRTVGPPMKFSRTPCEIRRPPLLGEHSREILQEMGFAETEIEQLHQDGVVLSAEELV
jgi:crotonobetainyl-CoA:carnitine CoA-transferase CaiB-like acyl-CoA transferase